MRQGALSRTQRYISLTLKYAFGLMALHREQTAGSVWSTVSAVRPAAGVPNKCSLVSLATAHDLLTPDLHLKPFSLYFKTSHNVASMISRLTLAAWQGWYKPSYYSVNRADFSSVLVPAHVISWVGLSLVLSYRIRYHALDRKLRKIVKNRYRYVRSYTCVREAQRLRYGLRLLTVGLMLAGERT